MDAIIVRMGVEGSVGRGGACDRRSVCGPSSTSANGQTQDPVVHGAAESQGGYVEQLGRSDRH